MPALSIIISGPSLWLLSDDGFRFKSRGVNGLRPEGCVTHQDMVVPVVILIIHTPTIKVLNLINLTQ